MNRSFFVAAALAAVPLFAFAEENCLLEAEDFQIKANWGITPDASNSGGAFLRTGASESDALTVVTLPAEGEYHLWVRARDFARLQPRARHYRIVIDGNPAERDAGIHGQDGWRWENVGSMQLTAGDHVIGLHDNSHFSARCDAILLTTDTADPNAAKLTDLAKFRVTPKPVTVTSTNQPAQPPKLNLAQRREVARIGNDQTRLLFFEVADEQGQPYILRETEVARNGAWERVPAEPGKETLYLLYALQSKLSTSEFFPFWSGDAKLEFTLNGKTYQTSGSRNPFIAGKSDLLIPRTCKQKENGVEIEFETAAGLKATGLWSLQPEHREAHFSLNFQAGQDGEYSVCFSPFSEWDKAQVAFNLLPPLFNFQRVPDSPTMSVSSTMPHALALVEPKGSPFTYAVAADPGQLSPDWPTVKNSAYGFSLLNSQAKVQPTIFAPVLGSAASKLKAGEAKTVSWSVLAEPGDWKATLEYASNRIFGVTDYRHPYGTSLTDAALNIIDLIKEGDHAGWDAKLKGFYNIESDMTVSQSGPLSVISAAMLTRDEEFYVKRALPTIEYTLSRPSPHFAAEQPEIKLYIAEKNMRITVPSPFYGAAYWQGVNSLLGRKNPWLEAYAYQDSKPRYNSGSSSMPKWSELMGIYRLDPKPELLEQLKTEADRFLEKEVYGRHEMTLGLEPFYNVSFYPYWWDLMDLYELTSEKRYLDAAEEGAFHTIAGLWSQPTTATGNVTVHPGGDVAPKYKIECYKGPSLYRLGYPRKDGDLPEKEVPGWVISRVGLGLEQPCTYFRVDGAPFYNILMSAWAPSLLRVYQYTGRDILQTYARDTIIGRFGNYPGYYTNAYSDRPIAADYPYKGPDITNLYYHHIPIHLAFTVDFLLTEAAVRSQGQIAFPWVKQQGYVWFSNRVYGGAPGKIYNDDGMRLWFNRKAVQVGSDQISYLTARNNHRFDLVLMNEAERAIAPALSLDRKALGIKEDAPYRVTINGKTEERRGSVDKKVSVPAKGLVVVSFPTREAQAEPEIPVLKAAPVAEKLGSNWGTLHAFRIRSPFGKDSLYAVLDGRPAKGSTVKLILDGEKATAREVTSYPYEFTVYPWKMDRDLTFHVVCTDPQGHETVSQPLTLKGNL